MPTTTDTTRGEHEQGEVIRSTRMVVMHRGTPLGEVEMLESGEAIAMPSGLGNPEGAAYPAVDLDTAVGIITDLATITDEDETPAYHVTDAPVPYAGPHEQAMRNRTTHHFVRATPDEPGRCLKCDARPSHYAADYPCGTTPLRIHTVVAL